MPQKLLYLLNKGKVIEVLEFNSQMSVEPCTQFTWRQFKEYNDYFLFVIIPPRYEPKTNELINEELGIAYPIIDGIPNMIPQEARLVKKDTDSSPDPAQE